MMRVEVEVLCVPYPRDRVEEALRSAGGQLASVPESVSVQVYGTERLTAILKFEMRRAAQYKLVDKIYATVKVSAWDSYEDISIRFPKGWR